MAQEKSARGALDSKMSKEKSENLSQGRSLQTRVEIVMVLVGLLIMFWVSFLGNRKYDQAVERAQSCLQRNGEQKTVQGVVKKAGQDFFAHGSHWHYLEHVKSRSLGKAVLSENIGQPVSVELCKNDVIAYTVDRKRFVKIFVDDNGK
ncbi:hypothetical protein ACLBKS_05115 [Hylemonella sp. W303a]|uniref:hypothetical protein n=1 Tax=Hylemonella sp. W303a TaxID=3389873 RepID=UPI00396B2507